MEGTSIPAAYVSDVLSLGEERLGLQNIDLLVLKMLNIWAFPILI